MLLVPGFVHIFNSQVRPDLIELQYSVQGAHDYNLEGVGSLHELETGADLELSKVGLFSG